MSADFDSLWGAADEAVRSIPPLKKLHEPAVRRAAERRHNMRHDDGRKARATGRTEQFNVRVSVEQRAAVVECCKSKGILIAEFVESAFHRELIARGCDCA